MEWLWVAVLVGLVLWPLALVIVQRARGRARRAPAEEYRSREHAETVAWDEARRVGSGRHGP